MARIQSIVAASKVKQATAASKVKAASKAKPVVKKLTQKQIDMHAQDIADEREEKREEKEINRLCKLYKSHMKKSLASQGVKTKSLDVRHNGLREYSIFFSGAIKLGRDSVHFEGDLSFNGKEFSHIGYEGPRIDNCLYFQEAMFNTQDKPRTIPLIGLRKEIDDADAAVAHAIVVLTEHKKIVKDFNERIVLALNSFCNKKMV